MPENLHFCNFLEKFVNKPSKKRNFSQKRKNSILIVFVLFHFVFLGIQKHSTMKEIAFGTTDNENVFFIPPRNILEVKENDDGTSTVAFVQVIEVKKSVEEIRKELSKAQIERIKWLTKSPLP